MKDCIFCKIACGEIKAERLFEDEICFVILDKFPGTEGQALIIPKEHIDYIMDTEDEVYSHLFKVAKQIGKAIDSSLKSERTCIIVEGFDVPHVHIRLHPTYGKGLITHGEMAKDEELKKVAEKIRGCL